jgi:hypothetical protein
VKQQLESEKEERVQQALQAITAETFKTIAAAACYVFPYHHAYLTDYHWDCLLYFVIISYHARTMTHTSTPTSSIWLVTRTDSLLVPLLVVSVAFQVLVLVVSAWHLVVLKLYH